MRCFYLPEPVFVAGATMPLPPALARHVLTVLRLCAGEKFELFNGSGEVAKAVLLENSRVLLEEVFRSDPPRCQLTLIQGLPKGDKLEFILQKGTELGVNQFFVTRMGRSVGQLKSERQEKKIERWEKIIQEASRQCRQFFLPRLSAAQTFAETLSVVEADLKLLLWEESSEPLAQLLPVCPPQRIAVVVGPEGGISREEADLAQAQGYRAVGLGPRILRTETAGIAIMTILQYLYGDLAVCQQAGTNDCSKERKSHEMS